MKPAGVRIGNNQIPLIPRRMIKAAKEVMDIGSRLLQSHIRSQHLRGGTANTALGVRSGKLIASLKPIRAAVNKEGNIESGVSVGPSAYARVHINRAGTTTTIRPKRAKYLTIPLEAARAGKGGEGPGRGSARFGPWTETFIAKTKAGALIIFGKRVSYGKVKVQGTVVRGVSIRKVSKDIVPLFLLKKSVKVKARVYPEEQLAWIKPILIEGFRKIRGVGGP